MVRPVYGIDERPAAWWEALLYGWQHTLVDISPFVLPLAVGAALGMTAGEQALFINNCLLAMGVATLVQTTLGNRLPIVQGPSATLTGALVPIAGQMGGPAMWGGVFAGGVMEAVVGASGALGYLRRLFPPVVCGTVVVAIGLALGQLAVRLAVGDGAAANFLFAGAVIAVIGLLQTALRRVGRGILARGAVLVAVATVGLGVGSLAGAVDWQLVAAKPWFGLPRLFPYGGPGFGWTFVPAALLGVAVGYLGSMVESLGDYAATCEVAGERYQVRHMNRGIFAEGVGSVLAACLGAIPVTSYTQNIGIIATTGVASRFVVRLAAGVLILYGLCPKLGALLVAMPRAAVGGVFVLVCGMIAMSGIRLIASSEPTPASSLTAGITLITAVAVPSYVRSTLGSEWRAGLPSLLDLLLSNTVVLAVLLAVLLNLVFGLLLDRRRPSA